jgi:uncharacterized protein with HEPN domain
MLLAVREYLQHILDEVDYLDRNSKELTRNDFLANETLQRAFVRSIEIIGEAVKHLPDEVRQDSPELSGV